MPSDPIPQWVIDARRDIGARVREARTAQKLTQEQVAELVGLDRKTINRIENGVYSTLVDHLLLLARALDVPTRDLVG
ncbi:helix-turn-helix transcriptional regulator [Streptomyces longwoodensis]|uniref:helix-turn-helix transcriptional regulator n=1 Tax=Streptomyces longwoodensis TaxID=68231 RepID=UPI00340D6449